jgi:predicted DNA-binding ribbon-helix-helix protein
MKTRLRKHSVLIAGHQTSITLEDAFWHALKRIARADGVSVNGLVTRIDAERADAAEPGNLSAVIRVYVLERLSVPASTGREGL